MRRAFVLALAIILAGCGGDGRDPVTKAEYEQRTAEIYRELAGSMQVPLATTEQRQDAAPRVARAMREAADASDAIEPPPGIEEPHDAYVEALRRCAARFEEVLVKQGKADLVFAELADLECVRQMQESIGTIEDAGYRIEDPLG